jgi:hypothetical protein
MESMGASRKAKNVSGVVPVRLPHPIVARDFSDYRPILGIENARQRLNSLG